MGSQMSNPLPTGTGVRIAAVVVTFHPDKHLLAKNIDVLARLGIETIVFDNTPPSEVRLAKEAFGAAHVYRMGGAGNIGLSAAYNRALGCCREMGRFDAVLFLDQDS